MSGGDSTGTSRCPGTLLVDGTHLVFDLDNDWSAAADDTWIEVHANPALVELYSVNC